MTAQRVRSHNHHTIIDDLNRAVHDTDLRGCRFCQVSIDSSFLIFMLSTLIECVLGDVNVPVDVDYLLRLVFVLLLECRCGFSHLYCLRQRVRSNMHFADEARLSRMAFLVTPARFTVRRLHVISGEF